MGNGELTGEALVEAHKEMARKMRVVTIAFPLILIFIIVAYLMAIVNQIKSVDIGAVGSAFSTKASALWPEIDDQLVGVAAEAQPVLAKALEEVASDMGPQIEQRLQSDMEQMMANVERDFRVSVQDSLDGIRERQREVLIRHVPEIAHNQTKQNKILDAMQDAIVKWAVRQLNTRFDDHLAALEDIRGTLEKSYMHPEDVPADPEDALSIWLDLMNEQVGGEASDLVPEEKKKRGKKGEPPTGKYVPVEQAVQP